MTRVSLNYHHKYQEKREEKRTNGKHKKASQGRTQEE